MLAKRPRLIFERRMHPPVCDAVIITTDRAAKGCADSYSFIADELAVAFVLNSGTIGIARDGITVRITYVSLSWLIGQTHR
jgi:hypothetical protein